jgi:hypothetical protein
MLPVNEYCNGVFPILKEHKLSKLDSLQMCQPIIMIIIIMQKSLKRIRIIIIKLIIIIIARIIKRFYTNNNIIKGQSFSVSF